MAERGTTHTVVSARSSSPSKTPMSAYQRPVRSKLELPESWLCAYCQGLLIVAFQTYCGCRFCEVCLNELASSDDSTQRVCPGGSPDCGPYSKSEGDVVRRPKPDKGVDRAIAKVIIICPNDCGIKSLTAARLFDHLRTDCPFQFCSKCKQKAERERFFSDHKSEFFCINCKESIPKCLEIAHRRDPMSPDFCPKFEGLCPLCNSEEIKANEMQYHRLFCNGWVQKCKYEVLKCDGDHSSDPQKEMEAHFKCLVNIFFDGKNKRPSASDRDGLRTEEEHRAFSDMMNEIQDMKNNLREDSNFMSRLNIAVEEVDVHRSEVDRAYECLRRATSISSLQSPQLPSFPLSPYLWCIPKYLELKKHESVIDSRPFLSHQYGYKMRVRLYLNGDGQGRNTHLSAYIILMAHDYDNLQVWPFQSPFLFTLLDQKQKGQDYQQLIHPNPKSKSFQRPPRTEADTARASGCAKFFPLERLTPRCNYLEDGTLYIKIDVMHEKTS